MPGLAVPTMGRSTSTALAAIALVVFLLLDPTLVGFFSFDFLFANLVAFAVFFLVVDLFDRDRFVAALVGFAVVRLGFVFFGADERCRRGDGERRRVSRGGRGEQHQRGEQEDQQVREFSHRSLIGAKCSPT
jgi:hypothetical protein